MKKKFLKKVFFLCVSVATIMGLSACKAEDKNTDNSQETVTTTDMEKESESTTNLQPGTQADSEESLDVEKPQTKQTSETEEADNGTEPNSTSSEETKVNAEVTETGTKEEDTGMAEEPETSESESLANRFYEENYGDMTMQELDERVLERSGYFENSAFYEIAMEFWRNEREVTDLSYRLMPLFYTDMKYYSEEDFRELPLDILILAQSEIYARHGCQFQDENIEDYFMGCVWYEPVEGMEDLEAVKLNEFEKHNNELLLKLMMSVE